MRELRLETFDVPSLLATYARLIIQFQTASKRNLYAPRKHYGTRRTLFYMISQMHIFNVSSVHFTPTIIGQTEVLYLVMYFCCVLFSI